MSIDVESVGVLVPLVMAEGSPLLVTEIASEDGRISGGTMAVMMVIVTSEELLSSHERDGRGNVAVTGTGDPFGSKVPVTVAKATPFPPRPSAVRVVDHKIPFGEAIPLFIVEPSGLLTG